jgi:hypothetical protein
MGAGIDLHVGECHFMTVLKDAPEVEGGYLILHRVEEAKDLGADNFFVFCKEPLERKRHRAAINTPDKLAMLLGHVRCSDNLPLVIDKCDAL